MPWKIQNRGGEKPYCVVKEGDGSVEGCHAERDDAVAQREALYASESKDKTNEEKHSPYLYVPYGVTDFDQLDEYAETREMSRTMSALTEQYTQLVGNAMTSPEISDKSAHLRRLNDQFINRLDSASDPEKRSMKDTLKDFFGLKQKVFKMEHGLNFSASDYAYTPDPGKPATWKLRLAERPGKVAKPQLAKAASELVGNVAKIPPGDLTSVKRRIRAEYRKLGVPETEIPISVKASFSLEKQSDGRFRFRAIYSNNYRDDDNPSEIISEQSHKTFAALVKENIVPPPELWVWHVRGSRIGVADHVDYADGFAFATGFIDESKEEKAQSLATLDDVAMSHGMPVRFIHRNPDDPSVIDRHITREISVLPRWAAANKYTGFLMSKEQTKMALTDQQKEFLRGMKFNDDEIAELDTGITQMAEAGENRERKETSSEEEEEATETPVAEADDEERDLKKEIADTLKDILGPIVTMIRQQNERVNSLEATVKELQVSDGEKIAKAAAGTPALSLKDLLAQALSDDMVIDGRSTLAKSKPKEAAGGPSVTGAPFLDRLMAGMGE